MLSNERSRRISKWVPQSICCRTNPLKNNTVLLIKKLSIFWGECEIISKRLTMRKHYVKCWGAVGSSGCACLPAVCIWLRFSRVKLSECTVERTVWTGSFPLRRSLLVTPVRYTAAVQQHRSWSPSHGTLLWISTVESAVIKFHPTSYLLTSGVFIFLVFSPHTNLNSVELLGLNFQTSRAKDKCTWLGFPSVKSSQVVE